MTREKFIEELKKINIDLTNDQLNQLDKFYKILIEWNEKINLTRIVTKEEVYLKHFYDSLTLSKIIDLTKEQTLCDVGTGAGFPGIVLKIVFPNLKITLVDSLNKRITYLNDVINKLSLNNIKAIHTRSEDYHEKYDIVTARAVAKLEKLIPWCIHLVNKNGCFIAMKANIDEEINIDKQILSKYDCVITKIESFHLPQEESIRNLIKVEYK